MRKIGLGYNAVPSRAKKQIIDVFRSGQFSPGRKVKEFEKKFAKIHEANHAVFVNSGTDALRLSLLAMKEKYGWRDGDMVAVPALTFVATVNVVLQSNLKPFFVDVGMYDYCINPNNLEMRLKMAASPIKNLRAVIPVHLFGQHCGDGIFDLAKKYKLKVLEDSCETILNPIRGDVSCHSTYMAHHVTTGVGGFALTNDEELAHLIWSYANHGRRERRKFVFDRVGYSCRATEFEAALGIEQLGKLEEVVQRRRDIFGMLSDALYAFWCQLSIVTNIDSTCMMFPIVLKEDSGIDKRHLCAYLEKRGIETRDMMPITNQPCYKGLVNEDDFPVAKSVNKNGFYIPCHSGMTRKDVEWIRDVFTVYLQKQ